MPSARPLISVPADASVRLSALTAAMTSPSRSLASRRTTAAIFSSRVFVCALMTTHLSRSRLIRRLSRKFCSGCCVVHSRSHSGSQKCIGKSGGASSMLLNESSQFQQKGPSQKRAISFRWLRTLPGLCCLLASGLVLITALVLARDGLVKLLCGRAIAGALGTAAGLERTNPRLLGGVIPSLNLVAAVETGKVEIEADKLLSLVAGNSHGCPQHRLTCEHCLHGHLSGSS